MTEPCEFPSLEEVPVDLPGSLSCSVPSHWSSTPSRRYGEVIINSMERKKSVGVQLIREGFVHNFIYLFNLFIHLFICVLFASGQTALSHG